MYDSSENRNLQILIHRLRAVHEFSKARSCPQLSVSFRLRLFANAKKACGSVRVRVPASAHLWTNPPWPRNPSLATPLVADDKHLMMFAADLATSSGLWWLPCLEPGSGLSGSVMIHLQIFFICIIVYFNFNRKLISALIHVYLVNFNNLSCLSTELSQYLFVCWSVCLSVCCSQWYIHRDS